VGVCHVADPDHADLVPTLVQLSLYVRDLCLRAELRLSGLLLQGPFPLEQSYIDMHVHQGLWQGGGTA